VGTPASTVSAISSATNTSATPNATTLPAATLDVTPPEVRVGDFVLSLGFQPAHHMIDQTAVFAAEMASQPTPVLPDTASQGAVVLADMVRVTNNLDPTQPPPADTAQAILRHAIVRIRSATATEAVPYLSVSMDVLLDGHPVSFGLPAVPMVEADTDPHLYYGNNVKLSQRGTYQVFVRVNRNLLMGKDQPQAAQFNVAVR
jgi:hypothetical protein